MRLPITYPVGNAKPGLSSFMSSLLKQHFITVKLLGNLGTKFTYC